MKSEQDFLKEMENLNIPDVDPVQHQQRVKMTIMNAERSAVLGVWLIAVPCYFLFGALMYDYFNPRANWFSSVFRMITSLDKIPYADFWLPVLLLGAPIACIIINLMAVVHVQATQLGEQQRKYHEFSLTIKVKPLNLLLILVSILIIIAFMAFAHTQNISVNN